MHSSCHEGCRNVMTTLTQWVLNQSRRYWLLFNAIVATISMCCMMENHNSIMIVLMKVCMCFIGCEIYLDVASIEFMWWSLLFNNLLIFFIYKLEILILNCSILTILWSLKWLLCWSHLWPLHFHYNLEVHITC